MRGPGGPAGLQNRFAALGTRLWRFDSPAFRDRRHQAAGVSEGVRGRVPNMTRQNLMPDASLTIATYNTFWERNGRDPALEGLLRQRGTMICLQEVNPARALGIKRALGSRAFVSLAKYGLLYLALVLPEGARFLERRTASLNGCRGGFPRAWSLRRSYALYKIGRASCRERV